jgi:hypothetical protein
VGEVRFPRKEPGRNKDVATAACLEGSPFSSGVAGRLVHCGKSHRDPRRSLDAVKRSSANAHALSRPDVRMRETRNFLAYRCPETLDLLIRNRLPRLSLPTKPSTPGVRSIFSRYQSESEGERRGQLVPTLSDYFCPSSFFAGSVIGSHGCIEMTRKENPCRQPKSRVAPHPRYRVPLARLSSPLCSASCTW